MYDLLFEIDVRRSVRMSLFLSCALTEVLAANDKLDKHLVHSES